ncbi:MAG: DUF475 domain-containing protein [Zoogloeaceae bacterium]|jgi:hypothetical protein|nr:DUF475 domain-containing protein [Zoogloeaceae bacterium]
MKDFYVSFFVTAVCLALAAWWGMENGTGVARAVMLICVLGVLEVSFSFDNAVVNAAVLKEMSAKWQKIFLTVGILIAVFGMRLLFPVAIVAVATGMGMADVTHMALERPDEYARHLAASHIGISAFGGAFLLLIFLSFLLNKDKKLHWLGVIEAKLSRLGELESISVLIALLTLMSMYLWLPLTAPEKLTLLGAGVGGVVLFIAVSSLDRFFAVDEAALEHPANAGMAKRNGVTAFLYLEVLDASFSFDGVIGAFAITRDVVIIMLGLGIGAMFVRSLTVHLVRKGTLDQYVFLEHGAHYAIGTLAIIMLLSIVIHVPELVTGLIGVVFIGLALFSSVRYQKKHLGTPASSPGR